MVWYLSLMFEGQCPQEQIQRFYAKTPSFLCGLNPVHLQNYVAFIASSRDRLPMNLKGKLLLKVIIINVDNCGCFSGSTIRCRRCGRAPHGEPRRLRPRTVQPMQLLHAPSPDAVPILHSVVAIGLLCSQSDVNQIPASPVTYTRRKHHLHRSA